MHYSNQNDVFRMSLKKMQDENYLFFSTYCNDAHQKWISFVEMEENEDSHLGLYWNSGCENKKKMSA